jgi:hypothetical protein
LKAFEKKYGLIVILFISLLGSSILPGIPNSSGQTYTPWLEADNVPDWVKNIAEWWAAGEIPEEEFLIGIEWMINNNVISLGHIPCSTTSTSSTDLVPAWFKNTAKWWSEDLIEESEFINGLEYLIKKQIIRIDNQKIVGPVPLEDVAFSPYYTIDTDNLVFVQSAFFLAYGVNEQCVIIDGNQVWETLALGLNPNKVAMYNEVEIWNEPYKTAVVYPLFTDFAYSEPGFYTYYRGECDTCTTTEFSETSIKYSASGIGYQALTLLGYQSITDIEIDRDPSILNQFDKVIMLHNEYVTRIMFDAITNHPNVIYLYPNALYAEIEVNYTDETITLIRGHNYPEQEITNGFDWEFDNTHPYEYDWQCLDMELYKIKNGWMTNCYPENLFLQNSEALFNLLKALKTL